MAHDEGELCDVGDSVRIQNCRPLSARKRFTLAEILQKSDLSDALRKERLPIPKIMDHGQYHQGR